MAAEVTFIMPAYNAAEYIGEAIASIRRQTAGCWKLIVVDDGSTDATRKIAQTIAEEDSRISVLAMDKGSGSAYQPRKKGILSADTDWVAPLDADDWIEPDYLEKLIKRQEATGADIVYPTMWRPAVGDAEESLLTPGDNSLAQCVMPGKDWVRYTLDGWRINCNGGLIRKSLYRKAFETFDSSVTYSCADELLGRQLLTITPRLAISDAKYFYRENAESITRKKSVKLFDFLTNTQKLIPFVKNIYGSDSEEYRLVHWQNFHDYFDALRLLNRYEFSAEDRQVAKNSISQTRRMAELTLLKEEMSPRYEALFRLPLGLALVALRIFDRP